MIQAQSPERIQWEEAVLRAIVATGVCQSDAQSIVETEKGEVLLNSLYEAGAEPALVALRFSSSQETNMVSTTRPTLRSIVKTLTAEELSACAQEVIAWQDRGVLQDGHLRALAARFEVEAGIDEMSSLAQAESGVLRETALRFIAFQTGLRAHH